MNYGRLAVTLGLPTAAGIGAGMGLHSILWGIAIGVGVCIVILMIVAKLNPAPAWTKVGTRAWEAKLTLDPLQKTIERLADEAKLAPPNELPKRKRELEFLANQYTSLQQLAASNDASPGRGYVGFDTYKGN